MTYREQAIKDMQKEVETRLVTIANLESLPNSAVIQASPGSILMRLESFREVFSGETAKTRKTATATHYEIEQSGVRFSAVEIHAAAEEQVGTVVIGGAE